MPTFRRAANLLENTFSMCHPWGAYGDAWRSARRDDLVCPNPRDMRGEPSSKCPKRTANGSCRRGCNRRLHGAFLRYNERRKVEFDEQTPFAHVRRLRGVVTFGAAWYYLLPLESERHTADWNRLYGWRGSRPRAHSEKIRSPCRCPNPRHHPSLIQRPGQPTASGLY